MDSYGMDVVSATEKLQEITKCSAMEAKRLLVENKNDMMVAVENFFSGQSKDVADDDLVYGPTDMNMNLETNVIKDNDSSKDETDKSDSNLKRIMSNSSSNNEETKKAFVVIVRGGRGGVHEMMIQLSQDKDTQNKFSQLRLDLDTYLQNVTSAGVDGAELMVLEDCPACGKPQILPDMTARLFYCREGCLAQYCRHCKVFHDPVSCDEWKGGVMHVEPLKAGKIDFYESGKACQSGQDIFQSQDEDGALSQDNDMVQSYEWREEVVNVEPHKFYKVKTYNNKPGNMYEVDPVAMVSEYQMAEAEFLRMMTMKGEKWRVRKIFIVNNKNLEDNFEMKWLQFLNEGVGDKAVLLFHDTAHEVDVTDVMKNNFHQPGPTDSLTFKSRPTVVNEDKPLIMCLVLEGKLVPHGCGAIWVHDVGQVLPKYVVHFADDRITDDNSSQDVIVQGQETMQSQDNNMV